MDDTEGLRRHLAEAERLAERHGFRSFRADHVWLRGQSARLAGSFQAAEEVLRKAIDQFIEAGDRATAMRTFRDLRQVYVASRRGAEVASLGEEFLALVRRPEARPWRARDLAVVLKVAEELEVPDLDSLERGLRKRPEEGS